MNSELSRNHSTFKVINPFKVWEKLYLSGENAITQASRNFVSTTFFGQAAELMLNRYLQIVRMQSAFVYNVLEDWPFPTKRDIARLARMNISLERKVDLLQLELEDQEHLEQYGCDDARRDNALIRPETNGADMNLIIAALQDIASRIDNLENLVQTHNQILMESRAWSGKAPGLLGLVAEESRPGEDGSLDPAESITILMADLDEQL
ncbi:MAG: hypothetical protein ABRQ24_06600 [Syntrophomonadaceae bacterium]